MSLPNTEEPSLDERALGYNRDAVKTFEIEGCIVAVPYIQHVPPSTTALIKWSPPIGRRNGSWADE